MWGTLSGTASGIMIEPAFGHAQIGLLFALIAVAVGCVAGATRPLQRAPQTHWSGLLEWCFDGHAIGPDLRA